MFKIATRPFLATKFICLTFLFFIGMCTTLNAQLIDIGNVLRAGSPDANEIMGEYLLPLGAGFGAGMNTGWNHMARPHEPLGFSFSVRNSFILIPRADMQYDLAELDLAVIEPQNSGSTIAPTISGEKEYVRARAYYRDYEMPDGSIRDIPIVDFNLPRGVDESFMLAPIIQLSVGIIHDTEIGLRYVPEFSLPYNIDADLHMFGMNIKHGINQWIRGQQPPVNISIQGGFTNFGFSTKFDVEPDRDDPNLHNPDEFDEAHWDDQRLEINATAWNINALVGKDINLIGVYGGLGFEQSEFHVATRGNYPVNVPDPTMDDLNRLRLTSVDEPLNTVLNGRNNIRAVAGIRLRLAFMNISGELTIARYSSFNVGLGVSFR